MYPQTVVQNDFVIIVRGEDGLRGSDVAGMIRVEWRGYFVEQIIRTMDLFDECSYENFIFSRVEYLKTAVVTRSRWSSNGYLIAGSRAWVDAEDGNERSIANPFPDVRRRT